jgi:polyisoprenoid-binding protein YceI
VQSEDTGYIAQMHNTALLGTRAIGRVLLAFLASLSFALVVRSEIRESWNLPLEANDSNVSAKFEVDTTWHTVHGNISHIHGRVWLKDVKDELSVQAQLAFPVEYFDTNSKSRDKELRECLSADKFPDAILIIDRNENLCRPAQITSDHPCHALLKGSLSMRGVTREIGVPAQVTRTDSGDYVVDGEVSFDWSEFGIPDPSILIARVQKIVKVSYSIAIPSNKK